MSEMNLVELSKQFAVDIVNICKTVRETRGERVISNQLLRSGTSIDANIHEGNYASSRLDFINKFQIAIKEAYETEYWLDIFKRTGYLSENEYKKLYADCSKLRKMLAASINTAKKNVNNTATNC